MTNQSNNTVTPAAIAAPVPDELDIFILPCGYDRWHGSRAQLEAEGLIPDDLEWPERDVWTGWKIDGFTFMLRRIRPPSLKGPMKLWIKGDYWLLHRALTAQVGSGLADAELYRLRQELAGLLNRQTPEGHAQWQRYCRARDDERFQAFKASLPGVSDLRRRRTRTVSR